jgi:hemin uptake protein HemP
VTEQPLGRGLGVRAQPGRGIDGEHGPPAEHPRQRQTGQHPAQPLDVDPADVDRVVERAVSAAVLRGQAQPDQRGHRPVGTQQRIGQLEQLIGPPAQAAVQLPAEAPQPIDRLRGQALLNPVGQVKTVHHGHRRSLRGFATPKDHAVAALMPEPEPHTCN